MIDKETRILFAKAVIDELTPKILMQDLHIKKSAISLWKRNGIPLSHLRTLKFKRPQLKCLDLVKGMDI